VQPDVEVGAALNPQAMQPATAAEHQLVAPGVAGAYQPTFELLVTEPVSVAVPAEQVAGVVRLVPCVAQVEHR
jgi:hypothetical protein